MKKLMIQIMALLFTAFLGNNIQASATGFYGTEVVGAVYCCTVNDRISNELTIEVGPGIEYQSIENSGENIVGANIDISDTWIDIDFTVKGRSSVGDFNGYIFDFSSINPEVPLPVIENISLNSISTFKSGEIGLSFDSDTIRVSLPNLPITTDSSIRVDVVFVDNCIVDYTINGPLHIPCLSLPSESIDSTSEVDMSLSPWPSCDYLIVETDSDGEWDATMDGFKSIYNQECIILIVKSTITPTTILTTGPISSIPRAAPRPDNEDFEAWTIAGYNDNGIFISAQIDDLENELIVKLKDETQNKSEVVKQLTSMLGRTPSYEPLAYTLTEERPVDSLSFNTVNCTAFSTTTVTFDNSPQAFIESTLLNLPCISVSDVLGNIGRYRAVFEHATNSEEVISNFKTNFKQKFLGSDLNIKLKDIETLQFTFKLIQAEKVD